MRVVSTHNIEIIVECANCISINNTSVRLNLSTNGGASTDPEYVRMVAPQFEPRKKVANFCVRLRASRSQLMRCYVILLEYPFPGKVGSDLGE